MLRLFVQLRVLLTTILQIDVGAQLLDTDLAVVFFSKKYTIIFNLVGISGMLPSIVWMNLIFNDFLNLLEKEKETFTRYLMLEWYSFWCFCGWH